MKPCIVVYADAWTAYGGSQFVDSPGTGLYHSYLCDEVVPWVDARFRTIADRESRASTGKSSGGSGAMITPMPRRLLPFRRRLKQAGVPDDRVYFELFDAGHGGIDYRYPLSLTWLAHRLARG